MNKCLYCKGKLVECRVDFGGDYKCTQCKAYFSEGKTKKEDYQNDD